MNVIWTPQPRQAEFMRRAEDEALYGGAAGGGKSDALVIEATRQVRIPHYKALILRKTFPQLTELIEKSLRYYPTAFPKAKYNDSKHTWTFPSGAKIVFGSLQHPKDKLNYQGKAYDFIAFDELTHFLWEEYSYLMSRNRANGEGTRVYMRSTANPGGIGHGWVKERFITPCPPGQTMWDKLEITSPKGEKLSKWMSRVFIPSSVFDNQALLSNDPDYVMRLAALPEAERKALLYGDWDSFIGQVFIEWRNDPTHYEDRINTHVIAPFKVPNTWRIIRSFDWGFTKPFSVGWYAVDHDNRIYRIRELYGCTGTPDVGVQWNPAKIAEEIKRIESDDPNLKGRQILGICDPAVFQRNGGDSQAEIMAKYQVYWTKADNSRISGKMQMHYRMAMDAEQRPMLYVFSTCKHCIRTLPSLVYSETDVEDVDTTQEDHIYDEMRYVCMANPVNPPIAEEAPPKQFDPLSTETYNEYNWQMKYL